MSVRPESSSAVTRRALRSYVGVISTPHVRRKGLVQDPGRPVKSLYWSITSKADGSTKQKFTGPSSDIGSKRIVCCLYVPQDATSSRIKVFRIREVAISTRYLLFQPNTPRDKVSAIVRKNSGPFTPCIGTFLEAMS